MRAMEEEKERETKHSDATRSGNDPVMGATRDHNSDQRNHNSLGPCGKNDKALSPRIHLYILRCQRPGTRGLCLVISDRISGAGHAARIKIRVSGEIRTREKKRLSIDWSKGHVSTSWDLLQNPLRVRSYSFVEPNNRYAKVSRIFINRPNAPNLLIKYIIIINFPVIFFILLLYYYLATECNPFRALRQSLCGNLGKSSSRRWRIAISSEASIVRDTQTVFIAKVNNFVVKNRRGRPIRSRRLYFFATRYIARLTSRNRTGLVFAENRSIYRWQLSLERCGTMQFREITPRASDCL